jgi:hypothetical protein
MRPPRLSGVLLLLPVMLVNCAPKVATPDRPKGVPASATRVDGAGGGSWIDCHAVPADLPQFECTVYSARTGSLYAKGIFAPDFDPTKIPVQLATYDGGGRITISDTTHLRAEGYVDFPTGDGHGHVLKYSVGAPAGRDSIY